MRQRQRAASRAAAIGAAVMLVGLPLVAAAAPRDDPQQLPIGDPARRERIARVVLDGITDTASGEVIDRGELARRLATARVLFIGEEHTNGECHRVQLHVIDALRAAGRTVVVALEMFPYSVIEPLRDWSAGKLSEQEFLQRANWYEHWSHHWGYYRDIFLYAREHGLRLVGINAPRAVVRQVRSRGFDSLDAATRERLPPTIDTSSKEHRRLVRSYFEADDPLHAKMSPEQLEGLYLAQVTWDAVMGWNAAQALSTPYDPREIVVVLIGAGHVAYGLGAERQLAPHFSGRIASLIPVTVRDDDGRPVAGVRASYANYIWGVPRTAQPTLPVLGVSLLGRVGPEPTTVIQIDKRSPAERAGLKVGDVLRSIDGAPIDGTPALQRRIAEYAWGDAARIALERDRRPLELTVVFRRQD